MKKLKDLKNSRKRILITLTIAAVILTLLLLSKLTPLKLPIISPILPYLTLIIYSALTFLQEHFFTSTLAIIYIFSLFALLFLTNLLIKETKRGVYKELVNQIVNHLNTTNNRLNKIEKIIEEMKENIKEQEPSISNTTKKEAEESEEARKNPQQSTETSSTPPKAVEEKSARTPKTVEEKIPIELVKKRIPSIKSLTLKNRSNPQKRTSMKEEDEEAALLKKTMELREEVEKLYRQLKQD